MAFCWLTWLVENKSDIYLVQMRPLSEQNRALEDSHRVSSKDILKEAILRRSSALFSDSSIKNAAIKKMCTEVDTARGFADYMKKQSPPSKSAAD